MYDLSVKVTNVKPGPVRSGKLRGFQNRWGIQADDKFGAQTCAQIRELEEAYWRLYDQLNQQDHATPFVLASLAGALAGFLLGMAL